MKRNLFVAMSAIAALASCSSDDLANVDGAALVGDENVAITLGVQAPGHYAVTLGTRGTGTVGSTDANENAWAGQTVNVFMFKKNTLNLATLTGSSTTYLYNNASLYTPGSGHTGVPAAATGLASRTDGNVQYYPLVDSYDFWGYRLDDAATGTYRNTGSMVYVPFKINGSQDVMVARTDNEATYNTFLQNNPTSNIRIGDLYSAKAARAGIQPTLIFRHLLTRLTFSVIAGNSDAVGTNMIKASEVKAGEIRTADISKINGVDMVSAGVYVDSIKVYSAVTGQLVVAYDVNRYASNQQGISWGTASSDSAFVSLMQRPARATNSYTTLEASNLVGLKPTVASNYAEGEYYTGEAEKVGEALMVSPAEEYVVRVVMHQYRKTKETWYIDETGASQTYSYYPVTYVTQPTVKLPAMAAGQTSRAGYSYNIKMTIFGLESIKISTTLNPWIYGGESEINME